MNSLIKKTAQFVQKELDGLCSAHDFHHIEHVWKLAKKIHDEENNGGDLLVIELGALLHESFDDKFYMKEQMQEKKQTLTTLLRDGWLDEERLAQVFYVIENVGYSKSLKRGPDFYMPIELAIVEDADRLESIGAIGIARTFSYGGKKKSPIYDPNAPVSQITDKTPYQKDQGSSIQHFYDKLLRLKDVLHTGAAEHIAEKRHAFMEQFLEQFHAEWNLEV